MTRLWMASLLCVACDGAVMDSTADAGGGSDLPLGTAAVEHGLGPCDPATRQWIQLHGGIQVIAPRAAGGFVAGCTVPRGPVLGDVLVVRWLNGAGAEEVDEEYDSRSVETRLTGTPAGQPYSDNHPVRVFALDDGGALVVANTRLNAGGRFEGWLLWLNADREPIAQVKLPERIDFAEARPDGGYVLFGQDVENKYHFVITDPAGAVVARHYAFTAAGNDLGGIAVTGEGALVVSGSFLPSKADVSSATLVALSPDGSKRYQRWLQTGCMGRAGDVVAHPAGGVVIAFTAPGPGSQSAAGLWLAWLDEDGEVKRTTSIPKVLSTLPRLTFGPGGTLYAAGAEGSDWWAAELSADLQLLWEDSYVTMLSSRASDLVAPAGGGLILAGGGGVLSLSAAPGPCATPTPPANPFDDVDCDLPELGLVGFDANATESAYTFTWTECPHGTSMAQLSFAAPTGELSDTRICLHDPVLPPPPPAGYRMVGPPVRVHPQMSFAAPGSVGYQGGRAKGPLTGAEVVLHDPLDGQGYRALQTSVEGGGWYTAEVTASGIFALGVKE